MRHVPAFLPHRLLFSIEENYCNSTYLVELRLAWTYFMHFSLESGLD